MKRKARGGKINDSFGLIFFTPPRRRKKQQYELNACALAAVVSTLGVYSFQYTMRLTSSCTALSASNFQLFLSVFFFFLSAVNAYYIISHGRSWR